MKIITVLLASIFLLNACQSEQNKADYVEFYPISIANLVKNEVEKVVSVKDSASKTVIYKNTKIEQKTIAYSDVENDLKSFIEFDINKTAWQKSYQQKIIGNKTLFIGIEDKLPLKYLEIIGDLKNPERVRIYFQNTNNLYQSIKLIDWCPSKSYSIFSIQDVKGMSTDTLFIKTYLR